MMWWRLSRHMPDRRRVFAYLAIVSDKTVSWILTICALIASASILWTIWCWAESGVYFFNFRMMNGDWQTYNPIRRLLDGYAPFGDFNTYLGLGPLYCVSAVTGILGGDFAASYFAADLLGIIAPALCVFLLLWLVRIRWQWAVLLSSILVLAFLAGLPTCLRENHTIAYCSSLLHFGHGNSLRPVRYLGTFLAALLLILLFRFQPHFMNIPNNTRNAATQGLIAGALFFWSNDYGIPIVLGILVIWFSLFTDIRQFRSFLRASAILALSLFTTSAVVLTLATWGNPMGWIRL